MRKYIYIGIGGFFGAIGRVLIRQAQLPGYHEQVPINTLFINVLGSVLIGVIAEWFALKSHLPRHWQLFLATGIMGGFTTFSTFSLETAVLYERGRLDLAALYVGASVMLSIGGLFAAMAAVRTLVRA